MRSGTLFCVRMVFPCFFLPRNLQSPGLADEICAETIPWLAATMGMMSAAFGKEDNDGEVFDEVT